MIINRAVCAVPVVVTAVRVIVNVPDAQVWGLYLTYVKYRNTERW